MTEWIAFIQGVGFPAAVAFFVLWRIEASVQELRRAIVDLQIAIATDTRSRRDDRGPGPAHS